MAGKWRGKSPEGEQTPLHIRLPAELVRRVDHLAIDRHESRRACVEWLLMEAMYPLRAYYLGQEGDG